MKENRNQTRAVKHIYTEISDSESELEISLFLLLLHSFSNWKFLAPFWMVGGGFS